LPFYQFWGEFEKTLNFGEQPILDFDNFMIRNKKLKAEFNLTQSKIIKENEKLKKVFQDVRSERVVIFSSLGGGSGSSSLTFISKILVEQGNKVLVVGVLPHKKEINPPLANAVQSINKLITVISDVSVILFNNEKLLKEFENDWNAANEHIIKRISYLVNLLDSYSTDSYSPMAIDKSELDSVVFGGGFIDVTDDFLEERNPKFTYGKISKETKNLLVAMFIDDEVEDDIVDEYHTILTNVTNKIAGRARNARLVPGVLRGSVGDSRSENGDIMDRAYITIASGLGIEQYLKQIEKIRDDAMARAEIFASKTKVTGLVSKKESSILDI
jgi:hypothetical protein